MKVDTHINFHLYHYAGNNPVRYVDPDGRQVAVPWGLPKFIPWSLPKGIPVPIPGELCPFPVLPNSPIYNGNQYYIEKPWNGDWHHAPSGPDMNDPDSNPLGGDWEPDKESNTKDKTGKHKIFRNKKTGETVRWDEDGKHWHRLNQDKSTKKKYPYLDPKGTPRKKEAPEAHIEPKPIFIQIAPPFAIRRKQNEKKIKYA